MCVYKRIRPFLGGHCSSCTITSIDLRILSLTFGMSHLSRHSRRQNVIEKSNNSKSVVHEVGDYLEVTVTLNDKSFRRGLGNATDQLAEKTAMTSYPK